jgi:hypothetical protein
MAEENQAPESDAESSVGGVDPVAIGLALAGAGREKADAFLAQQTALSRLQAEKSGMKSPSNSHICAGAGLTTG